MNLEEITRTIETCTQCELFKTSTRAVPGEGPEHAHIMLVGQNPGAEEDKTGRPFVGRSGKYLDTVLEKRGLNRKELFITSVVKHRTPDNREPTTEEIKACIPYLKQQIKVVNPSVVVLMGRTAWLTPRIFGIHYIETFHPAAAMRFPRMRKKFEEDFRKLNDLLL